MAERERERERERDNRTIQHACKVEKQLLW
jgi:hypothetical protein